MKLVCVKYLSQKMTLSGLKKLHNSCNGFKDFEQEIQESSKSASRILLHIRIWWIFAFIDGLQEVRTFFVEVADPQKYIFLKSTCRDLSIYEVFSSVQPHCPSQKLTCLRRRGGKIQLGRLHQPISGGFRTAFFTFRKISNFVNTFK